MDPVSRAVASHEDLYALLGVPAHASGDEIRHAYRSLARRHHPDANPGEAMADGFRRVAAAYEVLGDERDRSAYDRALRLEHLAHAAGDLAIHARHTGGGVLETAAINVLADTFEDQADTLLDLLVVESSHETSMLPVAGER